MFAIFTSVLLIAGKREGFLWMTLENHLRVALTVSGIMAVGTEVLQHYIPGRTMTLSDLIADVLGVLAGYGVYLLWMRIFWEKLNGAGYPR